MTGGRAPDGGFILLDGGLGVSLAARGIDTRGPLFSSCALLDARGLAALEQVHREFARAGAEVLTTATFRTSRRSLQRAGLADRFDELVQAAVRAARAGAAAAGETGASGDGRRAARVRIAGSLAPLEDCYAPRRSPPEARAFAEHQEHARALAAAGCDLLLVETICSAREGLAAVRAAASTGLAVWASAQLSPRGALPDGSPAAAFFLDARAAGAEALLINCTPCDGIDAALPTLRLAAARAGAAFGVYPQLGEIDPRSGWASGPVLPPSLFAARARRWLEAGASILGGCCGAGPDAIAALFQLKPGAARSDLDSVDRAVIAPDPRPRPAPADAGALLTALREIVLVARRSRAGLLTREPPCREAWPMPPSRCSEPLAAAAPPRDPLSSSTPTTSTRTCSATAPKPTTSPRPPAPGQAR